MTLTQENYYQDKSYISNSMLCDFVTRDKWGNALYTPELYYLRHIAGIRLELDSDAVTIGKIVDEYLTEGKDTIDKWEVVARRTGKNEFEITQSMHESIMKIITSVENYPFLSRYLKDANSKTQEILFDDDLKVKGKTDLINHEKKVLIDIKTTGSIGMIWDDIQFKGVANVNHRYIRQLALYRSMTPTKDYACYLCVIDKDGNIMTIPVRSDILDRAYELIIQDIEYLRSFDFTTLADGPIDPFKQSLVAEEEQFV